jgi:hypothetical protein
VVVMCTSLNEVALRPQSRPGREDEVRNHLQLIKAADIAGHEDEVHNHLQLTKAVSG